eukprot:2644856-Rhodomonas_salina.3
MFCLADAYAGLQTGMNEKVQLTKDVKDHIETALKIEQTDSASWHVLGPLPDLPLGSASVNLTNKAEESG